MFVKNRNFNKVVYIKCARDSGKEYLRKKRVEELLAKGHTVLILHPSGYTVLTPHPSKGRNINVKEKM